MYLESVEELLAHRADPNIASEDLEPPLCVAVRHRRRGIGGALLERRADINIPPLHPLRCGAPTEASHRWNWLQVTNV